MRRRRNADRSGKGLRHFSMKVCKKVEEKGKTTYNEVADELVEEVCVCVWLRLWYSLFICYAIGGERTAIRLIKL